MKSRCLPAYKVPCGVRHASPGPHAFSLASLGGPAPEVRLMTPHAPAEPRAPGVVWLSALASEVRSVTQRALPGPHAPSVVSHTVLHLGSDQWHSVHPAEPRAEICGVSCHSVALVPPVVKFAPAEPSAPCGAPHCTCCGTGSSRATRVNCDVTGCVCMRGRELHYILMPSQVHPLWSRTPCLHQSAFSSTCLY